MEENKSRWSEEEDVIDLGLVIHDFFRGLKKFWWLVLLLMIAGGGAMFLKTLVSYTPIYRTQASFTIMINDTSNQNYYYNFYYDQTKAEQMAATFPHIMETDLLTDLVKQDLGVSYINGSISASAIPNSNLCTISVIGRDPVEIKRILESVIENYPRVSRYVMGDTILNLIELPQVPTEPYNQFSPIRKTAKGVLFGAGVGIFLIGLYALLRKTIRKEEEIRQLLNVPCLGLIPQVRFKKRNRKGSMELSIQNNRTGEAFKESIRGIALRLSRQMEEQKEQVVMVTGTVVQEGTSTVAKNLAYAMQGLGKSVILLCFEENPINVRSQGRLELVLQGQCSVEDALVLDRNSGVRVISGQKRPGVSQQRKIHNMKYLVDYLRQMADVVVIDAPPISQMSNAAVAAECSDKAIYVIKQDFAKTYRIMEGIEELCGYDLDFAGCVLNQMQTGLAGYGYGKYGRYYNKYGYQNYGYSRYYGNEQRDMKETRR